MASFEPPNHTIINVGGSGGVVYGSSIYTADASVVLNTVTTSHISNVVISTNLTPGIILDEAQATILGSTSFNPIYRLSISGKGSRNIAMMYNNDSSKFALFDVSSLGELQVSTSSNIIDFNTNTLRLALNSLSIDGVAVSTSGVQMNYLNTTPGLGLATKALVLDTNKNVTGINLLSAATLSGVLTTTYQPNLTRVSSLNIETTLQLNGITVLATANEINYLKVTPGVASSSKVLMTDTSLNLSGLNVLSATSLSGTLQTASQPNITTVGTLSSLNVSGRIGIGTTNPTANLEIVSANARIKLTNGSFSGYMSLETNGSMVLDFTSSLVLPINASIVMNGSSQITGLNTLICSSIQGTLSSASASQPNITSIGTLTSLSVSGSVGIGTTTPQSTLEVMNASGNCFRLSRSGVVYTDMTVSIQGDLLITPIRNIIVSSGASIQLSSGNITGVLNLSASTISGTIQTAAQPNITSIGTLTALGVAGTVTCNTVNCFNVFGTIRTAAQPNITSIGTLASLTVSGTITANSVSASSLTGILQTASQTNITTIGTLGSLTVTGGITSSSITCSTVTATNLYGAIRTAAQPNITSIGTLSALGVTGTVTCNTVNCFNVFGTIRTAAQPNITSVGFLASVITTGNVGIGVSNPFYSIDAITNGNIMRASYSGNILTLTLSSNGNVNLASKIGSSLVLGTNMNLSFVNGGGITNLNSLSATNITGTLLTADQPNITNVGVLTKVISATFVGINVINPSYSVDIISNGNILRASRNGNIATFTMATNGDITLSSGIGRTLTFGNSLNLSFTGGTITNLTNLTVTNIYGSIRTANQPNITSLGTLTSLTTNNGSTVTYGTDNTINVGARTNIVLDETVNVIIGSSVLNEVTMAPLAGVMSPGIVLPNTLIMADQYRNVSNIYSLETTYMYGLLLSPIQPYITTIGNLSNIQLNGSFFYDYELLLLKGITSGFAQSGKVMVTDSANSIRDINLISTNTITIGGQTLTGTTAGYLANAVPGVALPNKILMFDSNRSLIGIQYLSVGTTPSSPMYAFNADHAMFGINKNYDSPESFRAITCNSAILTNTYIPSGNIDTRHMPYVSLNAPTIASTVSGLITSNASTLFVSGAPINGTGMTIANSYSIYVNSGLSYFQNGISFGGHIFAQTEASYMTSITPGYAQANKAVVVGPGGSIYGFQAISTNQLYVNGVLVTNATMELLDVTPGIVSPGKAVVASMSSNISGINQLSVSSIIINGTPFDPSSFTLSGGPNGVANPNKALIMSSTNTLSNIGGFAFTGTTLNTNYHITANNAIFGGMNKNYTTIDQFRAITVQTSILNNSFTSASGTDSTAQSYMNISAPTMIATNSNVTTTNASTLFISGAPIAGTNMSITNPYALYISSGASYFGGNLLVGGVRFSSTEASYLYVLTPGTAAAGKALVLNGSSNISGINSLGANSIVVGSSTITQTEAAYLTSLSVGIAAASKALVLNSSSNISGINSLGANSITIGSSTITATQAGFISGVTPGTAAPSKALVLDGSMTISGIVSLNTLLLSIGSYAISPTEASYIASVTPGTGSASKMLVLDASSNISNINTLSCTQVSIGGNIIRGTEAGYLTNITTGSASASKALVLDVNKSIGGITSIAVGATAMSSYSISAGNACIGMSKNYNNIGLFRALTCPDVTLTNISTVTGGTDIAHQSYVYVGASTISALNNSVTTTNTSSLYIQGAPSAGTNMTLTNSYALYVASGLSFFAGNISLNGTIFSSTQAAYLTSVTAGIASPNKVLVLDSSLNVSGINTISADSIVLGGIPFNSTNLAFFNSLTPGIASANKIMVVDSNVNIIGVNNIGTTTITIGSQIITSLVASYLTSVTAGVASASKVLVLDSSSSISGIGSLYINSPTVQYYVLGSSRAQFGLASRQFNYLSDTTVLNIRSGLLVNTETGNSDTDSTHRAYVSFNAPSISAQNSNVVTNKASTLFISGAPIASTNMSINNSYALYVNTGDSYFEGSLSLSGVLFSSTQANYLSGISIGVATPSKALVLDSSSNISGINQISTTRIVIGGTSIGSSETAYLTSITPGVASPSKAMVLNASRNISNVNMMSIGVTSINPSYSLSAGSGVFGTNRTYTTTAEFCTMEYAAITLTNTFTTSNNEDTNHQSHILIRSPTINANNSNVTTSNASSVYITGAPIAGANMTLRYSYALYIASGTTYIGGPLNFNGTFIDVNDLVILTGLIPGISQAYKVIVTDGDNSIGSINTVSMQTLVVNGVSIGSSELNIIKGITLGTAIANKALTLDANSNIQGLNSLSSNQIVIGGVTLNASNSALITGITTGVGAANKALTLNSSLNVSGINTIGVQSVSIGSSLLNSTNLSYLQGITPGVASASTALVLDSNSYLQGIASLSLGIVTTNNYYALSSADIIAGNNGYYSESVADTYCTFRCKGVEKINSNTAGGGIDPNHKSNVLIESNTLAAVAPSVSTFIASTVRITGPPEVGANMSINNAYSLYIDSGTCYIGGDISLGGVVIDQYAVAALDGITLGLGEPERIMTLDITKSISNIYHISTELITVGSSTITNLDAYYITGITPGTASASKALVLDGSGNIANIGNLSTSTLTVGGNSIDGSSIGYLSGITPGVASASKALVVDANVDISGIHRLSTLMLRVGGQDIGVTEISYISGITEGVATASKALVIDSNKDINGIRNAKMTSLALGNTSNSTMPLELGYVPFVMTSAYAYNTSSNAHGTIGAGGVTSYNYSLRANGRILCTQSIDCTSDRRLKKNIQILDDEYCSRFIQETKPVRFNWLNGDTGPAFGYIAQDLLRCGFHELVNLAEDDTMKQEIDLDGLISPEGIKFTVTYEHIIPILAHNQKKLMQENQELKDMVQKLINMVNQLQQLNGSK